ncbi:MAG: M20 family metallopeptidase [Bacillota bacterium]|nr:M20 family metallopeptidase [Bacillota bacterium]
MDTGPYRARIVEQITALRPELAALVRELHDDPEPPAAEHRSAARVAALLAAHSFSVETGVADLPTAFVARRHGGRRPGPTVTFLCEYDALPGVGHGCGHNLIAASTTGAAIALAKVLDLAGLPGTVLVHGTPDEEYDGGKILMAEAGLFDGIDAAMQIHPSNGGNFLGGSSTPHQTMVVTFRGRAAHTAWEPERGINALSATLITFVGLNALQPHLRAGTRIPATITDGGGAPNAVPERSAFRIHITTLDWDYLAEVSERVRNCARAGALASGAGLEIQQGPPYMPTCSNGPLTAALGESLGALGVDMEPRPPAQAATDVGNVSHRCPTVWCSMRLTGPEAAMHSREFAAATVTDGAWPWLEPASAAMALTGLRVLADPALRGAMWAEFRGTPHY